MKNQKNRLNVLKFFLLTKKNLKLKTQNKTIQLFNLKLLELQLKKTLKVFFKIFMQKVKNQNFFIFFSMLSQIKKKIIKLKKNKINFNRITGYLQKNVVLYNLTLKLSKSNFLQILFFFVKIYSKNKKICRISGNITNFILFHPNENLKKKNFYYHYNYLIFWNKNLYFLFNLIFSLNLKIKKLFNLKRYDIFKKKRSL